MRRLISPLSSVCDVELCTAGRLWAQLCQTEQTGGRKRAPEEGQQLLPAAGGPGEVHAVVAPVRRHHEAAPAAGVPHTVVVHPKTGARKKQERLQTVRITVFDKIYFKLGRPMSRIVRYIG